MTPLTDAEIAALREAVGRMTPGPWPVESKRGEPLVWHEMDGEGWTAIGPVHDDEDDNEHGGPAYQQAVLDSIGLRAMRNSYDRLLATLDALRAEVDDRLLVRTRAAERALAPVAAVLLGRDRRDDDAPAEEIARAVVAENKRLRADLATARAVAGEALDWLDGWIDPFSKSGDYHADQGRLNALRSRLAGTGEG